MVIDAGHGGYDPGAVANGLREASIALDISLQCAAIVAAREGCKALVTRSDDLTPSIELGLRRRAEFANSRDADCFVSIHANAAGNFTAYGHEIFHYYGSQGGRKLATAIFDAIRGSVTEIKPRAVKEAGFQVLRDTAMPAALVEVGFLTWVGDAEYLRRPEFREKMAGAIAQGIFSHLGLA